MAEKILVEHLVKKYGDNTVLNDINVSINEGDVVCIIGPSGSGKSTFLRCLNRLEEPSDGDIIIDGAHLMDKNTDINLVRQHIGMVFQHFNLFPHLSVLENIILAPMDLKKKQEKPQRKKQSNYFKLSVSKIRKICIQKCFPADKNNVSLSHAHWR